MCSAKHPKSVFYLPSSPHQPDVGLDRSRTSPIPSPQAPDPPPRDLRPCRPTTHARRTHQGRPGICRAAISAIILRLHRRALVHSSSIPKVSNHFPIIHPSPDPYPSLPFQSSIFHVNRYVPTSSIIPFATSDPAIPTIFMCASNLYLNTRSYLRNNQ